MYTINRPNGHPEGYRFSPLFCGMSNKGEIFFEDDQSTFIIYDPKNESFIGQKVIIDEYRFWEASIYIDESLVWPVSQKGMMQSGILRSLRKQTRYEQRKQGMNNECNNHEGGKSQSETYSITSIKS